MRIALLLVTLWTAVYAADAGFHPMFKGKDLAGWQGDTRIWRMEKGEVVGNTDNVKLEDNSFLITKREYGDFVLRTKMKLRNHNSGIQFRSEALPNFVVRGLQADAAEGNYWGSIYDEKGKRGVIVNGWKGKAETVVKANDWNDYEISAKGNLIQLRVNGMLTAELQDDSRPKGIIAFQVHKGPGMEVRFKDTQIKELR
jgi:hypothetical protein